MLDGYIFSLNVVYDLTLTFIFGFVGNGVNYQSKSNDSSVDDKFVSLYHLSHFTYFGIYHDDEHFENGNWALYNVIIFPFQNI